MVTQPPLIMVTEKPAWAEAIDKFAEKLKAQGYTMTTTMVATVPADTIFYARQLEDLPRSLGFVGSQLTDVANWKEDPIGGRQTVLFDSYNNSAVENDIAFYKQLQAEYEEYNVTHPGVSFDEWYDEINRWKQ